MVMKYAARTSTIILAAFGLCIGLWALPDNSAVVQVAPLTDGQGAIEVKPQSSLTLAFKVANASLKKLEFSGKTEIPPDWKLIMPDSAFVLLPGEETARLIGLFVPLKIRSGEYEIVYIVQTKNDASFLSRSSVKVKVLSEVALFLRPLEQPEMVIAGETYQSRFLLVNQGNDICHARLDIQSENAYDYQADVMEARLSPGESRQVTVIVKTDAEIRMKSRHRLLVKAVTGNLSSPSVMAEASTSVELIPRVSGIDDYYHRLPLEFSAIGLLAPQSHDSSGQFRFSGSGSLDERETKKIEFFFRGPGRKELLNFGLQQEEYWLHIGLPAAGFIVGDGVYSLTRLTEFGHYGRGAGSEFHLRNFSLKAYYFGNIPCFGDDKRRQKGIQLAVAISDRLAFSINYMGNKVEDLPEDQMASLKAQYMSKILTLNAEWAAGKKYSQNSAKPDQALWIEAIGGSRIISYQLNVIRAGADFPGYYHNLSLRSAQASFSPFRIFGVSGSILDQKINSHSDLFVSSVSELSSQVGLFIEPLKNSRLTLDYRALDRQDLSAASSFHYSDKTLRIGGFSYFGPLNIQASLDFGRTTNYLSGQKSGLREYMASVSYAPFQGLSLSGNVQYRDQDMNFTGEKLQALDVHGSAALHLGRTSLEASYRTSFRKEFTTQIFEEQSPDDPFLLAHRLNMLEVSLSHRFKNGHSVALRLRGSSPLDGLGGTKNAINQFIGFLEYSIPVNFPISRKADIGKIRGRVYDAENPIRGLPGVFVKANDLVTVTNKDGEFVFHSVKPDQYYISVDKKTIGASQVTVQHIPFLLDVKSSKDTEVTIGIVRSSSLGGRVVVYDWQDDDVRQDLAVGGSQNTASKKMKESGGLANTLVELKNEEESLLETTDDEGRFLFEEIKPGRWTLRVYDISLPEFHYLEKESYEFTLDPGTSQSQVALIKILPQRRRIQLLEQGEIGLGKDGRQRAVQNTLPVPPVQSPVLPGLPAASLADWTLQVGSFISEENAQALQKKLLPVYKDVQVSKHETKNQTFYFVLITAADGKSAAEILDRLRNEGYPAILIKKISAEK